jgi:hypothetical protein
MPFRTWAMGPAVLRPYSRSQEEEPAGRIAAGWLLAYVTRMGPLYRRMLRDQFGFAREVDALLGANGAAGRPGCPRQRSGWLEMSP